MRRETRTVLLVFCVTFLYVLFAGGTLFLYIDAHPGSLVPRWISVPLFCLFIFTIVLLSYLIRRAARTQARVETVEEGRLRRARAAKGLKAGLVLWGLILLNGIRLVVQREVPWPYAIPGLAVDILLVAIFWVSLKRLKKFEATDAGTSQQEIPDH